MQEADQHTPTVADASGLPSDELDTARRSGAASWLPRASSGSGSSRWCSSVR
jgi:hypothetical protein